jgi:hypothetical protein
VVQRKYMEKLNYILETAIARNLFRGSIFLLLNTVNTVSHVFRFMDGLDDHLIFSRLMTYIYIYIYIYICVCVSYRTANLQMFHFIYLFNKYTY